LTDIHDQRDTTFSGTNSEGVLPDPRILAFVRLIARAAAEKDYAAALKGHGSKPFTNED